MTPGDGRVVAAAAPLACMLLLLLIPSAANAAAIVVEAPQARAVVGRNPFRISFSEARGASVLREVENRNPGSLTTPPTTDPLAPGMDNPSTPTLYSPLSFLVGTETLQQYDGGLFGGNLMSGERSGVQYAAERVMSAKRAGRGMRLTLSTSDPSGRTLQVDLAPLGCCAISVRVSAHPAAGVATIGDSFASRRGEGFFGFGGRHLGLDQRGRVFSSFINEENINGTTGWGQGGDGSSLYPNGPPAAYYPLGEFVSSHRYGFLLDQPQLGRFKLAADGPDRWNVTASARRLSYIVAPGGARRTIDTLTSLSGRQPLPPRWALGPMMDRLVKNFGETEADYEANLRADMRDLRRYRIPIRAYRIEGWGFPGGDNHGLALHSFVSPQLQAEVIKTLRNRHIHPLAYLRPWVEPDSNAVRKGWVTTHADGTPYLTTGTAGQNIALIDFTNPAAVRYWKRQVRGIFDLGFDGFMEDFGEEVLLGMHFHDGQTGVTMHNRYLTLYHRATREEIDGYERRHPRRKLWFFTRAGYSGRPGATAYEGGNFPGDETTDWTRSSGLASSTPDMLNRAIGGAYGFGTDIGGYFDLTTPPTTKELFIRWAEWAALSPVYRLHGAGPTGTHAPWTFDSETVRIYRRLSNLHLRAVPLIMRLWRRAEATGVPPTRPLWLADPSGKRARQADQEWLLGPDLLVAPVVTEGATSRRVYLPPGCWKAAGNGRRFAGPVSATVAAQLGELPYFLRCGTHPLPAS